MTEILDQELFDELVSTTTTKKNIFSTVACVEKGDGSLSLVSSAGNMEPDKPYFIASVTKLYITAILLKLRFEKRLQLQDKITNYFSEGILHELHILKGIDYSKEITIKHLMSNTSGIPDYFNSELISELTAGKDQTWGFEKTLAKAKQLKPKFAPGKKAQYSDTNYQLLGRIIETIEKKDLNTVFKEYIFDKLELKDTYFYEDVNDRRPASFYYKDMEIHLPEYMSSIGPEGGIVSTAKESMIFLKAFMNGYLFPKEFLGELQNWRLLFGPGLFFYGIGISSQPISLKKLKGDLIGHWGQTGAYAFYHPDTDLYFTGTVNQFFGQSVAARMMIKIIKMYK